MPNQMQSLLRAAVTLLLSCGVTARGAYYEKEWDGSWNSTCATNTSFQDPASNQEGCITGIPKKQVRRRTHLDHGCCCTSCKPGYTFKLVNHKSMVGTCREDTKPVKVYCSELDKNSGNKPAGGLQNVMCTKLGAQRQSVYVPAIQDPTIRQAMSTVKGKDSKAVANCRLWKQTICREVDVPVGEDPRQDCKVMKEVKCLEVCKLEANEEVSNCQKELCEGDAGEYMCKGVAMMA